MIVTVTPNVALDVTYEADTLRAHASHRIRMVTQRAGGKGLNVAAVLHRLGHEVLATGWAPGVTGGLVRADLDTRGVAHDFADAVGETRRTVTVVSRADGDATVLNEPGPQQSGQSWLALTDHVAQLLARTGAGPLVLSGSLPPGAPMDGYAQLVEIGRRAGSIVVLDADGDALLSALAAGPDLVKPNRVELEHATGVADPAGGVAALRELGARDVVVSCGAEGLRWYAGTGTTVAAGLRSALAGNPTGAGDAAVAAIAAGLAAGRPVAEVVRDAVAWSAAAVLQPVAGVVDPADVSRLEAEVIVEEVQ